MRIKIKKIKPTAKNKKKGFSFMESMFSVFLVSVGLVVAVKLLTAGLTSSYESRDQFIASLLAQEGAEITRNIRDNNWVDNNPTTGSFNWFPAGSPANCIVNYTTIGTAAINCAYGAGGDKIYRNASGFYDNTAGGTATKFSRKIIITDVSGNKDIVSMAIWGTTTFPATVASCNTLNKCAYTEITLGKWGE
jgi:Tfp pilus assembly protein PilV